MNFLDTIRGPALAIALAIGGALATAPISAARAQQPKAPDEALDSLLEKLSGTGDNDATSNDPSQKPNADKKSDADKTSKSSTDKKPDADKEPDADQKSGAKGKAGAKNEGGAKEKAGAKNEGGAAAPSDVSKDDQELDDFLEKLGATRDEPSADDRPRGAPAPGGGKDDDRPDRPGPGPGEKNKDQPDDPARSKLSNKEKRTDEHLEELTGRRKKRRGDDGQRTGKVGELIKEMRDVEGKLTKPDTGEATREEQKKIVRNIDTLIEQARRSGGSALGRRVVRYVRRPGQRPGHQPGATGQGVGPMKPARPTEKHAQVGGKDIWGHLPPELRQQIENQAHEEPLVSKQSLIDRYYLSVGKGKLVREE